ncbi:hypothetical protein CAPTEDRAFT_222246 [Capitella teleta]|uniref:Rho-GAP domain-containing protein n=1 Tax=Capitella teleta TaxID=283909 RepID=R7UMH2_CAPTE|nr:hypothetical protein CAPTEDRAFT_222246 [Capitella teleta]|eukprot:ELU07303.1 hypothetical protein CAPTEDRAFT_222246 [Capitella teleta]
MDVNSKTDLIKISYTGMDPLLVCRIGTLWFGCNRSFRREMEATHCTVMCSVLLLALFYECALLLLLIDILIKAWKAESLVIVTCPPSLLTLPPMLTQHSNAMDENGELKMQFESPDMAKDFPGLYATHHKSDNPFEEAEEHHHWGKDGLRGRKEFRKDRKDRGYRMFEEEESEEELMVEDRSPAKLKKHSKPSFKFPKREKIYKAKVFEKDDKKEKEKEKEKKDKEKEKEKEKKDKEKEKEKKDKEKKEPKKKEEKIEKLKWKKKRFAPGIPNASAPKVVTAKGDEGDQKAVFGVPLAVAVERSKCHDGIQLPVVFRECIDYIEELGLSCEGIYRISGVKSKVQSLKEAYNQGAANVYLHEYEPNVVASLMKLYLRELPEPVLTAELMPKFEQASAQKNVKLKVEQFQQLIEELPTPNRLLLSWTIVHMEVQNKMSLQNVSIVLSPTMKISHRVLNVLFTYSKILFDDIFIRKYKAPLRPITSRWSLELPDSLTAIEEELHKQESLLNELHEELMHKKDAEKEEQVWEVQRVVTQLKRKLKLAIKAQEAAKMAKIREEEIAQDKQQKVRRPSMEKRLSQTSLGQEREKVKKERIKQEEKEEEEVKAEEDITPVIESQNIVPEDVESETVKTPTNEIDPEEVEEATVKDQKVGDEPAVKDPEVDATPAAVKEECIVDNEKDVGEVLGLEDAVKDLKIDEVDDAIDPKQEEISLDVKKQQEDDDSLQVKEVNDAKVEDTPAVKDPEVNDVPPALKDQTVDPAVNELDNSDDEFEEALDVEVPVDAEEEEEEKMKDVREMDELAESVATEEEEEVTSREDDQEDDEFFEDGLQTSIVKHPAEFATGEILQPVPAPAVHEKSFSSSSPSSTSDSDLSSCGLIDDEEFEEMQEEYMRLMLEEEELLTIRDELKTKIETERSEYTLLEQEITEVQAIREGLYDSDEDDEDMACYSDSSSDDEVDLQCILEQLIEENKKLEVQNHEMCDKIHEERLICLEVKVQIRMIQQRQLESSADAVEMLGERDALL